MIEADGVTRARRHRADLTFSGDVGQCANDGSVDKKIEVAAVEQRTTRSKGLYKALGYVADGFAVVNGRGDVGQEGAGEKQVRGRF